MDHIVWECPSGYLHVCAAGEDWVCFCADNFSISTLIALGTEHSDCHHAFIYTVDNTLSMEASEWMIGDVVEFVIYIIISQNIRYLLWNRGGWRSLNITHLTFLDPCIRCTNHLCDSCDLTDVNPHFIPSLLRKIQNVESIQEPTTSNCDVTMTDCSRVVAMDSDLKSL